MDWCLLCKTYTSVALLVESLSFRAATAQRAQLRQHTRLSHLLLPNQQWAIPHNTRTPHASTCYSLIFSKVSTGFRRILSSYLYISCIMIVACGVAYQTNTSVFSIKPSRHTWSTHATQEMSQTWLDPVYAYAEYSYRADGGPTPANKFLQGYASLAAEALRVVGTQTAPRKKRAGRSGVLRTHSPSAPRSALYRPSGLHTCKSQDSLQA